MSFQFLLQPVLQVCVNFDVFVNSPLFFWLSISGIISLWWWRCLIKISLLEFFKPILWPSTWRLLENAPCGTEKAVSPDAVGEMFYRYLLGPFHVWCALNLRFPSAFSAWIIHPAWEMGIECPLPVKPPPENFLCLLPLLEQLSIWSPQATSVAPSWLSWDCVLFFQTQAPAVTCALWSALDVTLWVQWTVSSVLWKDLTCGSFWVCLPGCVSVAGAGLQDKC